VFRDGVVQVLKIHMMFWSDKILEVLAEIFYGYMRSNKLQESEVIKYAANLQS
jgi:hypothetical protein